MSKITPELVLVTLGATAAFTLAFSARDYRDAIKSYHKKIQEIDSDPQLSLLAKDYPERPTYMGVLKDDIAEIKRMVWPW
jgi:hypothetical protein